MGVGPRIKLVAVDEDGTFLDTTHANFDRERFAPVFERMCAAGCHFVVATGNLLHQARNIFSEYAPQMGFVTTNGAFVHEGERLVAKRTMPAKTAARVAHLVSSMPEVLNYAVMGEHGAYMERGRCSQEEFDIWKLFTYRQSWVDDIRRVDDAVGSICLITEEAHADAVAMRLTYELADEVYAVSSGTENGYVSFDIQMPGVSKAWGLERLMEAWGISRDEVIAFGDADNDIEMLELAGRGFAMANGSANVKAAADEICPPNTESGVIQVLERYFPA